MAAKKKRELVVPIDLNPAFKKLYGQLMAKLKQATDEGASSWEHRYEAIAEILEHNPPLYLAGGYSTEGDFLTKQVGENRQAVYKNIRVAKYATVADIERYTPTRLNLAITFVETKNGGPLKGRIPIDFAKLRFPFLHDGKLVTKTLADITAAELALAINHLKGRDATSRNASPTAKALAAALKASGVKGATASVTQKTVTLRVPLDGLATVAKALSSYKPVGPKP